MVFHPPTVHHEQVPSGFRFSPRLPSQNRKSGGQYVLDLDPLPSARSFSNVGLISEFSIARHRCIDAGIMGLCPGVKMPRWYGKLVTVTICQAVGELALVRPVGKAAALCGALVYVWRININSSVVKKGNECVCARHCLPAHQELLNCCQVWCGQRWCESAC
jgi:hypothetical protein